MKRATLFTAILGAGFGAILNAQTPTFEIGTLYECPNQQSFKVISCAGARGADQCDVQSYSGGEATLRGNSTRQQVLGMVPRCTAQKTASKSAAGVPASKAGKTAAPAANAKAAQPPKAGLVSCAGKFEGRYAPSTGLIGLTIVFRSGKATLSGPLMDPEEAECWTGGGKIILRKSGEPDMPMDINDDGTIESPFGELKKKGN